MYKEAHAYQDRPEDRGKISEFFLLGRVKVNNPDYERGIKKCSGKTGEDFWDCTIEVIKQFQPFDPLNPQKRFPRDLRNFFIEYAGIKDAKKVKIFTVVDSIVDSGKHMDTFIEVEDGSTGVDRISLDHSLRDKDARGPKSLKADVFIPKIPDPEEDQGDYENITREVARDAAKVYLSRRPAIH